MLIVIGRLARSYGIKAAIVLTVGYHLLEYLVDEEEETVEKAAVVTKTQSEKVAEGVKDEDVKDDEGVKIPDEIPEDAIFIPLGLTRQRPRTYYKAGDPEWQSFVEYGKDRERQVAVRGMSLFTSYQKPATV